MSGVFTYIADLMSRGDTLDHALRLANQSNVFNAPTDVNTITGTPTGSVSDLITLNDNNTYDVVEVSGGMDVQVDFDVTRIDGLAIKCEYDGSSSHVVLVQLYNYAIADWDTFISIEDQLASNYRYIEIPDDTNYIDSGDAIVRFFHDTPATPNHDLYIDYVSLVETQPVGNSGNLSSIEGTAILSTGETGGSKYLREDGDGTSSWQTTSGDLLAANNLSDVDSASTSRTNLGLGTMAVEAAADYVEIAGDTMTGDLTIQTDLIVTGKEAIGALASIGGVGGGAILAISDQISLPTFGGVGTALEFVVDVIGVGGSVSATGLSAIGQYSGTTLGGGPVMAVIKSRMTQNTNKDFSDGGACFAASLDVIAGKTGSMGNVGLFKSAINYQNKMAGTGRPDELNYFWVSHPGVKLSAANPLATDVSRGVYVEDHASFGVIGGTPTTNVFGIQIDRQTLGTNNYGIWLANDNEGSDIVFGAAKDASIAWDGADLVIDSTQVTEGNTVMTRGVVNAPYAHFELTTLQNHGGANGTIQYVDWDGSEVNKDTGFTHSTVTNPSRIQVDADGRYSLNFMISCEQSGAQRTTLKSIYRINGGTAVARGAQRNYSRGSGYGDISVGMNTEVDLTNGDYVEVGTIVDDTDAVYTLNSIPAECEIIMRRLT